MAMIDIHRRSVTRKQEEVIRLSEQKAKEYAKIAGFNNKIQAATRQMNSSKSATTISNKLKEIHRSRESISKLEKKLQSLKRK